MNRAVPASLLVILGICAGFRALAQGPSASIYNAPDAYHNTWTNWFSGTNCWARTFVYAGSGCITNVTVSINNTLLVAYGFTRYSGPPTMRIDLPFDSTNFYDGTAIDIEVHVENSLGLAYDGHRSAPAYNKFYATAQASQQFSIESAQYVATRAGEMNHSNCWTQTDPKLTILGNLATYTAYFDGSDGGAGYYMDCLYHGVEDERRTLYASDDPGDIPPNDMLDIPYYVAAKTTQPPYNFVHLYVCNCASDSSLADAFGVTSGADHAFLGYKTLISDCDHNANWMNRVWQYLENGLLLQDAVNNASLVANGGPSDQTLNRDGTAVPQIYGDGAMKLHGLYGLTGTQWH